MRFILLAISLLALASLSITTCVVNNTYENAVGGHLKRAADAQTVEMAREELSTAVHGLEARETTAGYTSIFYRTPDEDIGFWYRNLNTSLRELNTLPAEATLLERSNILMRLRSTLLHHGEHGERVNAPDGIEWYPYNGLFATLWSLALLLLCAAGFWVQYEAL